MSLADDLFRNIQNLSRWMIETGLSDDQNVPYMDKNSKRTILEVKNEHFGIVLKNIGYRDMYQYLKDNRAYNFLMLDGALISLKYIVVKKEIVYHRLSFFPSPDLSEFQNNPEIYLEDEMYADVVDKKIVTCPLRFDYAPEEAVSATHPSSHLTIGQYANCRIPVSAPLLPHQFLEFIMRHFYNTPYMKLPDPIPKLSLPGMCTLTDEEKKMIHLNIPA